jgi:phenylalanyl-tRNA synthetase beta chain
VATSAERARVGGRDLVRRPDSLTKVSITCPQLCSRYIARVIRGVRIGPSPDWLVQRLQTIGIATVNNVVDVTNYVLMECGQPLHAFDLAKLAGPEIIVREALPGEQFLAINHKLYDLQPGMCVIADAERSVALGGVMGGADTEVGEATTDSVDRVGRVRAAVDPHHGSCAGTAQPVVLSFRTGSRSAGRRLGQPPLLPVDPGLAGGELAEGAIDVGPPARRASRWSCG